jgi:hypothetical protein
MIAIAQTRKPNLKKRLIPPLTRLRAGSAASFVAAQTKKEPLEGGSQGKTGRKSEVAHEAEPSESRKLRMSSVINYEGF